MAALSSYLINKVIDSVFRAQALPAFPTLYMALYTAAPSAASASGTEVTGGAYARVAITASLLNFAGTQADASTVASTGTSGKTSNNGAVTFPAPTAAWGSITGFAIYDAAAAGNELVYGPLSSPKTVNATDPAPSFAVSALALILS